MSDRPYALGRFIAARQSHAMESNSCDFRPTYQSQLDLIERDCTEKHARGQELIAGIKPKDVERCRKLLEARQGNAYGMEELQEMRLKGQWVLAPRYFALFDEVQKLKKILA